MPRGVNRVILLGFIGNDPEVRDTTSGSSVVNLRLATSETFRGKDGPARTHTEWHRLVAFGRTAEVLRLCNVQKGMQVYVEGSIKTRKWQDKSGQDRWTTEIVVREFEVLGGRADAPVEPGSSLDDIPW